MQQERIHVNYTIELLKENLDKQFLPWLSENPNAISILEKNQDKINWVTLSSNPNAISLLKKNPDKINWCMLSSNEGKNEINYPFLKERMDILREDLMKAVYHPKRFRIRV